MADPLVINDLSLQIGGATILEGISLEVQEREILGIIGPNGAGKTSFFNLLSGLRAPTRGTITMYGVDITHFPPHKRAQSGLARTFQTSSVFGNLTLVENVRIAAASASGHSMNLTRNAYKFEQTLKTAAHCLEQVGLISKMNQQAGALSHGDKRRLEIAIVLASESKIVLLDEPMAGMSVENIPELVEIIRSLSRTFNKTVLIVEHHMDVVLDLADRIAVLNFGELLVCDSPEKVIANPIVQSAYLGVAL